jgi:drug/metabolite transporter (DMT)-like permease
MDSAKTPRRSTLILGLMVAILASSTAAIFIRFAQAEEVPSIVIAAARLTIASLLLAPVVLTSHRSELGALTYRGWLLALLSGIFLALHFAFWITSLEYTSVASSVVLVSTTPLWVAILSPFVLHERVSLLALLGLLIALAGGTIIGLTDSCTFDGSLVCPSSRSFFSGDAFLGDLLALAGAWMAAGYLLVGRKLRTNISLLAYIFIVYGMAALVLIGIMLGMGQNPFHWPPLAYLWFILLALIPQLFGHSTFNWVLKYLSASLVSVALLGEPIGSTILAYIFFQETPGWIKIFGAVMILAGILLSATHKNPK